MCGRSYIFSHSSVDLSSIALTLATPVAGLVIGVNLGCLLAILGYFSRFCAA
ncbi:MAG: hypothetical protein NVSMB2_27410 [Chloroflexota bacterium]